MWNTQAPSSAGKSVVPARSAYDIPANSTSPSLLGASILENLYLKGFCTVALGLDGAVHEAAIRNVDEIWSAGRFQTPPPLIVDGLLGDTGSTLIAHLEPAGDEASNDGQAIRQLDSMIADMGAVLAPLLPQLDFEIEDRTAGLLHQTGSSALGSNDDLKELEAQKWLTQFWWHRLMVCIFLGPEEGSLELVPYGDEEAHGHMLTVQPGTMVVLRPDLLAHYFASKGRSIALTAFFMQSVVQPKPYTIPTSLAILDWITQRLQVGKAEDTWDESVPRELQQVGNHLFHKGPRIAVRSCPGRLPSTWDADEWMCVLTCGPDLAQAIPFSRWDHTVGNGRYDPHPEGWRWGQSFVRHGCFCDGLELFDNRIFNLSLNESKGMDPQQRALLEVSYEGLWNAGLRKKDIFNSHAAVYVGLTTSDFTWSERSQDVASAQGSGIVMCIYSNRINYCLGLKGPSISIDQEGASAITAVHLCRVAVEDHYSDGEKKGGAISGHGIGLGTYFMTSNRGLSLQCSTGILSAVGRCLSFDASACGCGRGEATAGVVVKPYTKLLDGNPVVLDPQSPPMAVLASTGTNCSGMATDVRAPHGPAIQEIICNGLEEAKVSPLDINACEVHGEGRLLSDVVDVGTALFALRQDNGSGLESMPELALGSVKSNVSHAKEAAAALALIKAIMCSQKGVNTPSAHLRVMNPYIDAHGLEDLAIVNGELLADVSSGGCSFTTVVAHGYGGSNSMAMVWNTAVGFQQAGKQQPPLMREALVFWPGGGGELEEEATDCQAYHIVGSWTKWEDPEPMEPEGDGTFGFTVVLGENGFEHFQILLDGDSQRVLHPGQPWGLKNSAVFGPDEAQIAGAGAWAIDGRRQLALGADKQGAKAILDEDLPREAPLAGVLVETTDTAEPGEAFRVRLKIAGKWRVVTWEKIGPINPDLAPERSDGEYFITGDFNGWTFDRMTPSYSEFGLHSIDVRLIEDGGLFQIVRDCSWEQVFHPLADQAETAGRVIGPDSRGEGKHWSFKGYRGDIIRVNFSRTREEGMDVKKLSWQCVQSEAVTERELMARGHSRLFLVGSWDGWEAPRALSWDGSAYSCRVRIGDGGMESFQILLGGYGSRKLYPSKMHAGPHRSHMVLGPMEGDLQLCWTIGYHPADEAEVGSAYSVRALVTQGELSEVTWQKLR